MTSFATGNNIINKIAASDLSGSQYLAVSLNVDAEVAVTAVDGAPGVAGKASIGFLANKPIAGETAEIWSIGGGAKALAGGTIAAGERLTADATGKVIEADAVNEVAIAISLSAAVSGDILDVLVISDHVSV